jgi:lactate dehydrogenase-like 2-hydroxyacid dehydrogenase
VLLDLHSELTAFLVLQMLKDISELKAKLTEARSALTALTEERNSAIQHSLRLQEELANTKIAGAKSGGIGSAEAMKAQKLQTGFSFLFVLLVGFLGMLVGYLVGG